MYENEIYGCLQERISMEKIEDKEIEYTSYDQYFKICNEKYEIDQYNTRFYYF